MDTIIKIRTAGITSCDPTITLPDEIHVADTGEATACHASSGDVAYATIEDLCAAYGLDAADVIRARCLAEADAAARNVRARREAQREVEVGRSWGQIARKLACARSAAQRALSRLAESGR